MKTLNWKAFLAGFGVYFVATRPLLSDVLPGAPILPGDEMELSPTLLWLTFFWHVIAAFAAGMASAAFARGAELAAGLQMGAVLALMDSVRAIRISQDPGQRPGLAFMLILFVAVMAACTAGSFILARIRGRNPA